jgi:protein SCO1/2
VRLVERLERGDLVRATLHVTETDAWLSAIQRTGAAPVADDPAEADAPAAPTDLLEPGQAVPDTHFTDQDGQAFDFGQVRGKAVAVTFIYTRCPLPTFCPLMDRHFARAQRLAAGRADLAGRVQLVTVSFDPAFDTPAVLKQHARAVGADESTWRFVTAPAATVDEFAARLGVAVVRERDEAGGIVHNLRTAVIAPDGRIHVILSGGDWTPERLVEELGRALQS